MAILYPSGLPGEIHFQTENKVATRPISSVRGYFAVVKNLKINSNILISLSTVPRLVSAVTWSHGPRPWRGFTHGPLVTGKCPLRVRMQPDHEHGNGMGRVDMERGPDSV